MNFFRVYIPQLMTETPKNSSHSRKHHPYCKTTICLLQRPPHGWKFVPGHSTNSVHKREQILIHEKRKHSSRFHDQCSMINNFCSWNRERCVRLLWTKTSSHLGELVLLCPGMAFFSCMLDSWGRNTKKSWNLHPRTHLFKEALVS